MRRNSIRVFFIFRHSLCCLTFLCFSVFIADAQSTGPFSGAARRVDDFNRQADKAIRDDKNRDIQSKKAGADAVRKAKAVAAEIEEDLEALQASYNQIVTKLQSKDPIADQFVVEAAARINKHAGRLKVNIKFPDLTTEEKAKLKVDQTSAVRKRLINLCTEILAFFDSRFFANPSVIDVATAREAAILLESVLIKSDDLRSHL